MAIVRVEQLYPMPAKRLGELRQRYANANELAWVQEEPHNMGAWSVMHRPVEDIFGLRPRYVGREASASPATGAAGAHKIELARLLDEAFGAF